MKDTENRCTLDERHRNRAEYMILNKHKFKLAKKEMDQWEICRDENLQNIDVAGMHKKLKEISQKTYSFAGYIKSISRNNQSY